MCVCACVCVCVCVCGSHNSSGNNARNFDSSINYTKSAYLIGAYPLYVIKQSTMPAGLEEKRLSRVHSIAQPIVEISVGVTPRLKKERRKEALD